MLKQRKRKVLLGTGVFFVVVLVLLLWPLRSWTRQTLALNLVGVLHGPETARIYNKDFSVINNALHSKGFQLIDKTLPHNDRDPSNGCRVDGYQGIHETLTCQKVSEYKPKSPKDFKELWLKQAPSIEVLLEQNGWRKQYPDQPEYTKLFDTPATNGNWLTSVKNHGKVSCELTVAYNPPYPNPDDQIWIHERCIREVKFFGGY